MVPDRWAGDVAGGTEGRGAGTYALRLLLAPGAELGLRYRTVATAFRLFANGVQVARAGSPAVEAAESRPAFAPGVTALPGAAEVDLTVWVANHEYRTGGIWRPLVIGERDRLLHDKQREDLLYFGLSGFLAAIAFGRLSFFLFRTKELSSLFLCLFSLVLAFRILVTGDYDLTQIVPGISFDLLIRLEYSTAFLSMPLAVLYFGNFFSLDVSPRLTLLLAAPTALFSPLLILAPLHFLTSSVVLFYAVAVTTIVAVFMFVFVPAIRQRRRGVWAIFVGGLCIALTAINDMLYSSYIVHTGNLLPLGLTLFIGAQALVVTRSFIGAFSKVETLSDELATANEGLEREMALSLEMQQQLKATLGEKEMLLREVHHRVKNSLQIVSSIVTLQAHREKEPAALDAYSKVKNRLRAVSMVHEKLFSLKSGELIDFGEYARELVAQLADSYGSDSTKVDLSVETDRIDVPMAYCIDAGLLLTELIANAYKHAVIPKGGGQIHIILRRVASTLKLTVEDDGPGFPKDFAAAGTSSLGFKIVTTLLKKWNGGMSLREGPGGSITVFLPLEA